MSKIGVNTPETFYDRFKRKYKYPFDPHTFNWELHSWELSHFFANDFNDWWNPDYFNWNMHDRFLEHNQNFSNWFWNVSRKTLDK